MSEARLDHGVPTSAGWFVVNARDARWLHNEMRAVCRFGGEGAAHFDDLGIGLGAGAAPALVLAVGARKEKGSARYPVDPAAVRHGAGVTEASLSADQAYAAFGHPHPGPAPEIFF